MSHNDIFAGQNQEAWDAARRADLERHATPWVNPLEDPIVIKAVNEALAELAANGTLRPPTPAPVRTPLSGYIEVQLP